MLANGYVTRAYAGFSAVMGRAQYRFDHSADHLGWSKLAFRQLQCAWNSSL